MGAEQSSQQRQSPTATRKTCYYEVLGVERQAGDDEIRRAYKKKALELHPDRNLDNVDTATRRFAEVQTAYEILSDPQERAWYDSHRDAILGGYDDDFDDASPAHPHRHGASLVTSDHIFALMGRFSSAVPMTDGPDGFFGILNKTFDQLAREEADAWAWDGGEPVSYPAFGAKTDGYDSVARPFYNAWSSFSTKKSFSWKDKYRLSDAPDRRVRRLMDKENKKLRDDAVRDFNDAVRSLVAFVKKRDPRYVPNSQSEAERQKVLRNLAAAQAARSRVANQQKLADFVVPEWAQSRDNDDRAASDFSISEAESEIQHIECVICNKVFKSEQQFEAHERSKKHLKAVQQVRRQMRSDDVDLSLDASSLTLKTEAPPSPKPHGASETQSPFSDPTSFPPETVAGLSSEAVDAIDSRFVDNGSDVSDEAPEELSHAQDDLDDYAPRDKVASRLSAKGNGPAGGTLRELEAQAPDPMDSPVSADDHPVRRVGKAKAKRERKAARQAASNATRDKGPECTTCRTVFSSRNELFSHLRETKHVGPAASAPKDSSCGRDGKRSAR